MSGGVGGRRFEPVPDPINWPDPLQSPHLCPDAGSRRVRIGKPVYGDAGVLQHGRP